MDIEMGELHFPKVTFQNGCYLDTTGNIAICKMQYRIK